MQTEGKIMKKLVLTVALLAMSVSVAFAEGVPQQQQPYRVPPVAKASGDRCTAVGGIPGNDGAGNYTCCRGGLRIRPDGSNVIRDGKTLSC